MSDRGEVPIQAIDRTFRTLEVLTECDSAGVTELADRTALAKSTVHNHLRTLDRLGFVINDDGRYRLSLRFLEIGHSTRRTREIFEKGKQHVDQLADETGDLAALLVEEEGRGVYLHRSMGSEAIDLDTYPGKRIPIHASALGKAILARYRPADVRAIVDRHGLPGVTDRTITDEDELFREFEEIRERGHAFDDGERHEEIRSVASPITDSDGGVRGAVGVSAPASRLQGSRFREEVPDRVANAATLIEIDMTYS